MLQPTPSEGQHCHGRAGTAILYHLSIYHRTQPLPVATTGRMGLLEHGQRCSTCQGRRTLHGAKGRPAQRRQVPNPPGQQDLPGTTGRQGAADAAADSESGLNTHGTSASPTAGHVPLWPLGLLHYAQGGIQH